MPVLKWETCDYCDRSICLFSDGVWYDGMNRPYCTESTNSPDGSHSPFSEEQKELACGLCSSTCKCDEIYEAQRDREVEDYYDGKE